MSVYDSQRLAAGYAFDRPPVHQQILSSARLDRQAEQALDVGCGAGLPTAAQHPWPGTSPPWNRSPPCSRTGKASRQRARFVTGAARRCRSRRAAFDLVTAAGSLNYTNLPFALSEIARVLTGAGKFLLVRLFR